MMPDQPKLGHYIEGACNYSTASAREVINTATEEILGLRLQASVAEMDATLSAAQKDLQTWLNVVPFERSGIMRKAADLVHDLQGPCCKNCSQRSL